MPPQDNYKRSNKRVIGYCLIVGLVAVLYGLDAGETSGFLAMPRYNEDYGKWDPATQTRTLTASQQSSAWGLTLGVACVAAAISGTIGTRFGRKFGLFLAAFFSTLGPAIQCGVTTWGGQLGGKAVAGLGVGFAANFVIPYWAETTPATLRGVIIVMYQAIINVAQFVGQCINEGTHDMTSRWAYRAPLLTELLPPLILIACLYWLPETPRWYATRGRSADALKSMGQLRGPTYPQEEIQDEVKEIIAMIEIERELEGSAGWLDCFRGTDLRRTTLTVMSTACQEFSGIAFITGYGTYFFTVAGVTSPFTVTVISGMCGILGSLTSFALIKYVGRRPILIGGAAAQGTCMLIFAIVAVAAPGSVAAGKCLAAFVSLFIYSYGATWGAVSQVLLGELPSSKLRSKTVALATSAGWIIDILIICGMPYLISPAYANLGGKVGFIFGGCQILVLLWAIFFIPETKDRTLEEIDEMFMNKISAWNFKSYVVTQTVQGLSVQSATERLEEKGTVTMTEQVA